MSLKYQGLNSVFTSAILSETSLMLGPKITPSHIAQLVKNLPAVQETSVRFLGWEYLLEKG